MNNFVNLLKSILNFLLGKKKQHKTVQETVYETIKSFGERGCISDQVLKRNPSMPYPSVTARYRELLKKNLVECTGEHRPGNTGRSQRVMRAKV